MSLLAKLRADYPAIGFAPGDDFRFCPAANTIQHPDSHGGTVYYADEANAPCILHELSHALLGHDRYGLDIDLLKIERSAWDHAVSVLAPRYGIRIDPDTVEDSLDTYRDWLHNRSLCPSCSNSGLQHSDGHYACVLCLATWRANEARACALRRYPVKRIPVAHA